MENKKQKHTKIITEQEYKSLPDSMKGTYKNYYNDHPEWEGRRIAAFPCELPGLFIEGVNLKIV